MFEWVLIVLVKVILMSLHYQDNYLLFINLFLLFYYSVVLSLSLLLFVLTCPKLDSICVKACSKPVILFQDRILNNRIHYHSKQ